MYLALGTNGDGAENNNNNNNNNINNNNNLSPCHLVLGYLGFIMAW